MNWELSLTLYISNLIIVLHADYKLLNGLSNTIIILERIKH